jgi:hypothetical protein
MQFLKIHLEVAAEPVGVLIKNCGAYVLVVVLD